MRNLLLYTLATILILTSACGTNVSPSTDDQAASIASFGAMPADGVQPWEQVDSRGFVIPPTAGHGTSALDPDSYFQTGVERFSEVGLVTDDGDTSVVVAGSNSLSGGIYRFPMGGVQPGAVAIDVNLHQVSGKLSQYWLGFSDYGKGTWVWSGPFADGQITKAVVAGSNNLSGLGNFFVAIAGTDDVAFDIVGVTVSSDDVADTTAPPVPAGLTATPVVGGLELNWNDVIAADLAGYQIYWSYSPFTAATGNGVNKVQWLENTTRMVLPSKLVRDVYITISAVDTSGNASALSAVAGPYKSKSGTVLQFGVTTPEVSLNQGDPLQITASGSDLYDFDTDGDGVFEVTGSASGVSSVDTSATGIIRPRVRGTSTDGFAVAFGSVSLIVSGNQRPSVSATATPSSGAAPLNVALDGEAFDPEGGAIDYAWDLDGDGIFDTTDTSPGTNHIFALPGLYNVKLRATDDQGAWDVDTVAVQATGGSAGTWVPAEPRPDVGAVGGYSKLLIVGGRPAIGYDFFDPATVIGPLKYVRAADADGTSWSAPVTVDPNGGFFLSMAIVAGNPAMSYYDQAAGNLMFVRALDPNGTAWDVPKIVDGLLTDVGKYTTLLVVGANPAISYYDTTNGNLRYVRANTADGSSWGVGLDADPSPDDVGAGAAMALIGGSPAICYFNSTTFAPMYVRATNPNGLFWGTPNSIAGFNATTMAFQTALVELNGLPMAAFRIESSGALAVARSFTQDGTDWLPQFVEHGEYAGYMVDLEVIDGRACLAYMRTIGEMVYRRAATSDASAWFNADPIGGYAYFSELSLGVVNGKPAVTFGHLELESNSYALSYWRQQ